MHRSHGVLPAVLALVLLSVGLMPASSQEQRKCASIQSADGRCVDPALVDAANKRASIVSSGFASYVGTPIGSVGLPFIPHERLYRDDPVVFGLPTNTEVTIVDTIDAKTITTTKSK
jgi:hypothetical protein